MNRMENADFTILVPMAVKCLFVEYPCLLSKERQFL